MAKVVKGQAITAEQMNGKVDNDAFIAFGAAIDDKFEKIIFVGTDAQWNALSANERNKYIMRGIPR